MDCSAFPSKGWNFALWSECVSQGSAEVWASLTQSRHGPPSEELFRRLIRRLEVGAGDLVSWDSCVRCWERPYAKDWPGVGVAVQRVLLDGILAPLPPATLHTHFGFQETLSS